MGVELELKVEASGHRSLQPEASQTVWRISSALSVVDGGITPHRYLPTTRLTATVIRNSWITAQRAYGGEDEGQTGDDFKQRGLNSALARLVLAEVAEIETRCCDRAVKVRWLMMR